VTRKGRIIDFTDGEASGTGRQLGAMVSAGNSADYGRKSLRRWGYTRIRK